MWAREPLGKGLPESIFRSLFWQRWENINFSKLVWCVFQVWYGWSLVPWLPCCKLWCWCGRQPCQVLFYFGLMEQPQILIAGTCELNWTDMDMLYETWTNVPATCWIGTRSCRCHLQPATLKCSNGIYFWYLVSIQFAVPKRCNLL